MTNRSRRDSSSAVLNCRSIGSSGLGRRTPTNSVQGDSLSTALRLRWIERVDSFFRLWLTSGWNSSMICSCSANTICSAEATNKASLATRLQFSAKRVRSDLLIPSAALLHLSGASLSIIFRHNEHSTSSEI